MRQINSICNSIKKNKISSRLMKVKTLLKESKAALNKDMASSWTEI